MKRLALSAVSLLLTATAANAFPLELNLENASLVQFPPVEELNLEPQPQLSEGYIWPAQGVVTSGYGKRWGRMHKGIDIGASVGTPIRAAADGVVVYARWNTGGYGQLVKIRHSDGAVTLYGHNNRLLVVEGQPVEQGQLIAEMGSTGRSTGPHLHFEIVSAGGSAVNPLQLLARR